jgi:outer membrane lipoprotein LolB
VPLPSDLSQLDRWQARGRLGISSRDNGGSGSFEWRQQEDRADVLIRGPVGIGSVRLQMHGEGAKPELRLQTGDGQSVESQAAWIELEARLGAPVPAGSLRYWMLGLAAPGPHEWRAQSAGGVSTLEQDGWQIEYEEYANEQGAKVPVKIRAANGATRIRIVVDRWQLGQ